MCVCCTSPQSESVAAMLVLHGMVPYWCMPVKTIEKAYNNYKWKKSFNSMFQVRHGVARFQSLWRYQTVHHTNQSASLTFVHMAGMANTAPRPCLFTHSQSHTHIPTISCTCCYDEIKGIQDLKIYSHADSLSLSLFLSLSVTKYHNATLLFSLLQTCQTVHSICLFLWLPCVL